MDTTTTARHTECPTCGYAFRKPQPACKSAKACARRAAARTAEVATITADILAEPADEPRVYRIPDVNLADFTARMAKLTKRAEKLGVPAPAVTVVGTDEVTVRPDGFEVESSAPMWAADGELEVRTYTLVTVVGEAPKYAGWTFVAAIDRDLEEPDQPNVVNAPEGTPIAAEWRTMGDVCDHCPGNAARGRKTLVVVRHDDGAEKVVGTTCLRDFLGHTAPASIASWAELILGLDDTVRDFEDEGPAGYRGEHRFHPTHYLTVVAACIDAAGWVPRAYGPGATADLAAEVMDLARKGRDTFESGEPLPAVTDRHVATAEKSLAWALELPIDGGGNDYLANLRAVAGKSGFRGRDLGLAASMVSAYHREVERVELARREAARPSAHVGTVGKRESFGEVTVTRVIPIEGYAYNSPTGAIVKMVTDDGDVIVWKSSRLSAAPEQGARIVVEKATVKEHGEWNGKAETKVARMVWAPVEADDADAA